MATDVVIAVGTRGASAAARSINRLEQSTSKWGAALKTAAVGGAIAAGVAVGKFALASVDAASKAQQSLGATETVFGRYAKTVIRESNRAADAVGLSANEYRELANVTGASLSGAGIPIRKTTELTGQLTKRAADMAATFGGTTREAIEAVGSALRGETDPIERYGVSVKEADVSARLAAKGQDQLTGAAGKQASMMARLELIFEKTSKTQGAFAREGDTLAGAQQRLAARVENLQAKFGKLLLPALTAGVNLISRKVIPAAEDLADWLARNQDEIESTASAVAAGLLPPLQTLASLAASAAKFVAGLPPELQSLAAQAAAAALVLPRLNAALTTAGAGMTGFVGNVRNAETRTKAFAGAARQAGGVAGVLALSHGIGQTNDALGVLETTAGGALLGFGVGGPWGAAIGGGIGLLGGLWKATRKTADAMPDAKAKADALAASIERIAAASGKAQRAEALRLLQTNDMIGPANRLGISTRTMVSALLGNQTAIAKVNGAWRTHQGVLDSLGLQKITGFLRDQGFEIQRLETRTRLGADQNKRFVDTTKPIPGNVQRMNAALGRAGDAKPTNGWSVAVDAMLRTGQARAKAGAEGTNVTLRNTTGRARPNLAPFASSLYGQIDGMKGTASGKANSVGSAIGSGMKSGIDAWVGGIVSAAQAAVNAAIAAARAEAKAKSPSRRTIELGNDIGEGLRVGLKQSEAKNAQQGSKLIAQIMSAAVKSADDLDRRIREILEKHKIKDERIKRVLKSIRDETKAIRENAAAQAALNTRLDAARDKLKSARSAAADYARSIRDAIVESGNITNLGLGEEGTATSTSIVDDLRQRVNAAKRFESLIDQLRGKLSKAQLQQLLARGVEGGLTTAEALVAGGPKVIREVNTLSAQLAAAGTRLGADAAQHFHGAGIAAAAALVRGLERDSKELDRAADRFATKLANAVRDALKKKDLSGALAGGGKGGKKPSARATLDRLLADGGGGGGRVTVKLTAQQLSQLERGRAIQLDIDAAGSVGFRKLATA